MLVVVLLVLMMLLVLVMLLVTLVVLLGVLSLLIGLLGRLLVGSLLVSRVGLLVLLGLASGELLDLFLRLLEFGLKVMVCVNEVFVSLGQALDFFAELRSSLLGLL